MRRGSTLIASVAACLAVLPNAASAATIGVTETADDFFASPGGSCSLREAVQAANTDADFGACVREGTGARDTIVLQGGQTYARSRSGVDDTNDSGDLDITGKTTIEVDGTGRATIDGNDMDRVIDVRTGGNLTASDIVVTDGRQAPDTFTGNTGGGGIRVEFGAELKLSSSEISLNETLGSGGSPNGGGLDTFGDSTLERVTIGQNSASGVGGGIAFLGGTLSVLRSTVTTNRTDSFGGGIYLGGGSDSSFRLVRSTLTQNHAHHLSLGGGGGIYAGSDEGRRTVSNSTISTNYSDHDGGGIYLSAGGDLKVNATTITGNYADYEETGAGAGGGVGGFSGGAIYRNSIIADNFNPLVIGNEEDCHGPSFLLGGSRNLVGDATGCREQDQVVAADPKLGPLAENGGPTQTHKLKRGSRAVDRAASSAPAKDQRGRKRDAHPDIGAYER